MRIALGIEYDGTHYHGWQKQENLSTIQGQVEEALSKVADASIYVSCAGRTDAGVHAYGQVVHFDTEVERPIKAWILGTNGYLPANIKVHWAKQVSNDFHARFSATARQYRYVIFNSKIAPAILRHHALWYPYDLNESAMQEAANYLLGEHDFSSFRGSGCQSKSKCRCVEIIDVKRDNLIVTIDVKANAFLLHMVRNIVGLLLEIGRGEHPPIWAKEVLELRDRTACAATVPAQGLYLMKVDYGNYLKV